MTRQRINLFTTLGTGRAYILETSGRKNVLPVVEGAAIRPDDFSRSIQRHYCDSCARAIERKFRVVRHSGRSGLPIVSLGEAEPVSFSPVSAFSVCVNLPQQKSFRR